MNLQHWYHLITYIIFLQFKLAPKFQVVCLIMLFAKVKDNCNLIFRINYLQLLSWVIGILSSLGLMRSVV